MTSRRAALVLSGFLGLGTVTATCSPPRPTARPAARPPSRHRSRARPPPPRAQGAHGRSRSRRSRGTSSPSGAAACSSPSGTRPASASYARASAVRSASPAPACGSRARPGLMSLAVDPRFEKTRRFWSCQGWQSSAGHDIRVSLWKLSGNERRAKLVKHVLTGLPTTSGRHGGCRCCSTPAARRSSSAPATPRIRPTRAASPPSAARCCASTAAPVRRWRTTRTPMPATRASGSIYTYGHRNVQGLAQRVRRCHGQHRARVLPRRRGQRSRSRRGLRLEPGPGYDESVPMTDQSLPGEQTEAIWSSGDPTIATSERRLDVRLPLG